MNVGLRRRLESLLRSRYDSEVEPWLAGAVAHGLDAVRGRAPALAEEVESLLDALETACAGGDADPNDLLRWLRDPGLGTLRRHLAHFGYHRAAGVAGADGDDHLLVYGSLRRDQPGHRIFGLTLALQWRGLRRIRGELHDLGDYPGLVAGDDRVVVELYRVRDASVLAALDEYEGYRWWRALSSPYRRTCEQLRGPAGGHIDAWVYRYNGAVAPATRIARGCWSTRRRHRLSR